MVAEEAQATRGISNTRLPDRLLRALRSTCGPVIPQLARISSAPFSDDVNVGCFRKCLSRIGTHCRVHFSSERVTKCLLSHLEPKGWSGLLPEVLLDPLKARPVGGQTGLGAVLWAQGCRNTPHDALLQRPTCPHAGWAASLGHLGLQGAGQIQVPPDGIVVGASTECHKEMPDGMGKGDPPVTLEEHHAQAVEDPSGHQLPDALGVGLSARTRVSTRQMSGQQDQNHPATPTTPDKKTRGSRGRPESQERHLNPPMSSTLHPTPPHRFILVCNTFLSQSQRICRSFLSVLKSKHQRRERETHADTCTTKFTATVFTAAKSGEATQASARRRTDTQNGICVSLHDGVLLSLEKGGNSDT